jgi:hypothetical protein
LFLLQEQLEQVELAEQAVPEETVLLIYIGVNHQAVVVALMAVEQVE